MKVVLDTNIYLSGLVFKDSNPAKIIDLAKKRNFDAFCSRFIIDELRHNLIRKFNYSAELAQLGIIEALKFTTVVCPNKKVALIKEKETDNRILECALAVKANYLISGDKKHILPLKKINGTKIVSAWEFIELLKNE